MLFLSYMLTKLQVRRDERGATAVEYGLLVALIAAVIIFAVMALGTQIRDAFQFVVNELGPAIP